MPKQTLAIVAEIMAVHSLPANSPIPSKVLQAPLFFIGKTAEELSVVVPETIAIDSDEFDGGWRALEVLGPLSLSMVGIMAGISAVLAQAKVSIFVVSTFETDFFLVKNASLESAVKALEQDGYTVIR
ncbi:ACT domain-containing protein [Alteromonas oceanisediminis]|uniref:ACT domain-containing protein n=1 Tax=Alteromonas oceanisediminis TaxID=2836180 RepID=UPI001BDB39D0|nr:ACT domain-containing protein [Alteromonas oceanisediminis]MBT0587294.1 ACT domain-containing protein [Alteromonas oceanisediminis]